MKWKALDACASHSRPAGYKRLFASHSIQNAFSEAAYLCHRVLGIQNPDPIRYRRHPTPHAALGCAICRHTRSPPTHIPLHSALPQTRVLAACCPHGSRGHTLSLRSAPRVGVLHVCSTSRGTPLSPDACVRLRVLPGSKKLHRHYFAHRAYMARNNRSRNCEFTSLGYIHVANLRGGGSCSCKRS